MARPRHTPDGFIAVRSRLWPGYRVPEPDIAGLIGIDPKTLRKDIDRNFITSDQGQRQVAENLFRKAAGEGREAVTAAIFSLKSRARCREAML
ncbi:hypothetical protein FJ492_11155 [Mesorhizobium sp. B2-5-4]|uniref:hypothetical protein n=1 Tax=unclassified Mesorhizobium TaxID=325217 RepID=UPI0011280DA2|nr:MULTISPECIES: hypothetical protein [unclassified Mesorhizobium]TPJ88081.1 hypothetical protein FJ434_11320 [Mesorhizobium sp. B2-5-13]TPK44802.1 hypothetical protein FJ492_11155 [Mesorhizobium sp. B2-5-4]TPK52276.1 hypothetical protein FJ560_06735 [Mesorhizobium sp. B2-5-5]TPL94275.1 hypothetical protein FJ960_28115 [Mesorhizobium sp. B2-3-11]